MTAISENGIVRRGYGARHAMPDTALTGGIAVKLRRLPFENAPASVRHAFDGSQTPQASWAWFAALAESVFGPRQSLEVLALMDEEGGCQAAIPLLAEGRGFQGATSPYTTQFAPPLGQPETAFRLGRALAKQMSHLRLDCLDESDPTSTALIEGLRAGGMTVACYRHFANWHDRIDEFEAYWTARSSRLKSLVQRKSRQLERGGRLRFAQIDLSDDQARGTDLYEGIYARSWKAPEQHPSFIAALLRHLGPTGAARLAVAYIDGKPAAAQIWLLRPPCATIFKLAHDPEFETHSPGSLLTRWFLRQCHQQGVQVFDFGRGDDAYKRSWLGQRRYRYGVVAANPRTVDGLYRLIAEIVPTRIARLALVEYVKAGVYRLSGRAKRLPDRDRS